MPNISAPRDNNRVPTLIGTSSTDGVTPVTVYVDPTTHRLKVDASSTANLIVGTSTITGGSNGRVLYDNSGVLGEMTTTGSGTVLVLATSPTLVTPALGVATATSINGNTITSGSGTLTLSTFTLTVAGTASISGTNTGDQTSVTGNAGTATALQNARTIGGVSFNGTANITVATATGGFTVSGGDLAIGANNLTITGSIASTGSRVTKGWFTDLEVTNAPTLGGVAIPSISSTNTLTNKRITPRVTTTNAPGATPTINSDNSDVANFTGLGTAITSMTTNLSGTPTAYQKLIICFTDDGTARGITWGSSFESSTVTLPTTTVISTLLTVGFLWNSVTSKWRCVAVA